jgi:hypothetical protein
MIRGRRLLTAVAAGIVCTIGIGLTLLPDPPQRMDPSAFLEPESSAPETAWDICPTGWDPGSGAIVPAAETVFPGRPVYRHSVVPGGVYSRVEVEEAVFRMPDVAEHYRGVNIRRLAPAEVSRDGLYYASYRRDGAIYWTSHRLKVNPNETVLGDGSHLVRARCGNLLSEEPMLPILPAALEPVKEAMDSLDVPPLPLLHTVTGPPGFWTFLLPIIPVLIFPGGGGHGDHHVPPVPTVPEPSPARLIGLGLVAIAAARVLAAYRAHERRRPRDSTE